MGKITNRAHAGGCNKSKKLLLFLKMTCLIFFDGVQSLIHLNQVSLQNT